MTVFEAPQRANSKLRIAIQGLSFSGKTFTALSIATGLVGESGKIALVDCEGGESELYADDFVFSRVVMEPPYTPEKFIECIEAARDEGYDCVILDTISNEWAGEGGLLEDHERVASQSNNRMSSYSSWGSITPRHNKFIGAILRAGIHVIATIRSKPTYAINNVNGVNKPVKISNGPMQRDNIIYEFSVYMEMDDSHAATIKKDRTRVIGDIGTVFEPNVGTGEAFRRWINGDDSVEVVPVIKKPEPPKQANLYHQHQVDALKETYSANGWNDAVFDVARRDDGLYDADKITTDYNQRQKLKIRREQAASVKQEPIDTHIVCDGCGKIISEQQAKSSRVFSGKALCEGCGAAIGGKK